MSFDDKKQPIVIKKINKGGHGHHGGSWKVAYADFVTAMMAFFLLMWLLGSTTEGEKAGVAEWFKNPSAVPGPGGASTSMIELGGAQDVPEGEGEPLRNPADMPPEEQLKAQEDQARLDELLKDLKELIETSPSLQDFKDQLLIDITSEGLRIQIVDKENRPMFDLGGTELKWYTRTILRELGKTINEVPNRISIAGHTDAMPYATTRRDYSNWELSADRANAARRELKVGTGMGDGKFGRVVGLASSVLFDQDNAYNPINRRISIIVLNRATERAIGLPPLEPVPSPMPPALAPVPERALEVPDPAPAPPIVAPLVKPVLPRAEPPLPPAEPAAASGAGLEQALSRVLGGSAGQ
jgi:chemotaxis protein MotB